ncbi:hypothetical protein [Chitinophaga solisilvae]|uniref:Uncharacterized protein n=1 Tax=Chitinophaga solisilvae TaxID=1233460 RepID=A0A3S1BEU0_9BACT|nr:hypothetical protein [Chitinophaga solisilvae]NSL88138.1 hypothetical protein [Chitinophaga solisilvae]
MKKVFVFAIAAGMFFVACNGGSTPAADSTATTVDTMNAAPATEPAAAPVADSAAHVDSAAAPVADSAAAAPAAK